MLLVDAVIWRAILRVSKSPFGMQPKAWWFMCTTVIQAFASTCLRTLNFHTLTSFTRTSDDQLSVRSPQYRQTNTTSNIHPQTTTSSPCRTPPEINNKYTPSDKWSTHYWNKLIHKVMVEMTYRFSDVRLDPICILQSIVVRTRKIPPSKIIQHPLQKQVFFIMEKYTWTFQQ